jgi:hypothetical protein
MFIQAVESGVPPCVDIPTYEEYKTQSKELLSVCYCAKPSCFGNTWGIIMFLFFMKVFDKYQPVTCLIKENILVPR